MDLGGYVNWNIDSLVITPEIACGISYSLDPTRVIRPLRRAGLILERLRLTFPKRVQHVMLQVPNDRLNWRVVESALHFVEALPELRSLTCITIPLVVLERDALLSSGLEFSFREACL